MPKMFSPSKMFFNIFFAHENMKKPASKVAEPAQIQPKSQFLFHKNLPPRDFSLMTLPVTEPSKPLIEQHDFDVKTINFTLTTSFTVSICAWFLKCQFGSLLQTRKKKHFKSNLIFFLSSYLIFTACVAYKNQFLIKLSF